MCPARRPTISIRAKNSTIYACRIRSGRCSSTSRNSSGKPSTRCRSNSIAMARSKNDRWSFTDAQLDVLGEGQGEGQGRRLVEFLPARRRDRRRPEEFGLCLYRGRTREESAGVGNHELLGAGHRQHGSAGARRHQGTEREVAKAAFGRRNPFRLCHDRAQRRFVGRQEHLDHGKTRRRRMGDQRREILHLRPRRSPLQDHDRDGEDQSGRAAEQAAVADPGAKGHARRRDHRTDARVRARPCAARPHASALQQCPGAEGKHPARRRPRLRDLAGSPRAGPHPSLHAHHRQGGKSARPDGARAA